MLCPAADSYIVQLIMQQRNASMTLVLKEGLVDTSLFSGPQRGL